MKNKVDFEKLSDEMDQAEAEILTETSVTISQTENTPMEGKRQRRAIAMKNLLPNPDWINVNVVARGKGHKEVVGRIFGTCTGYSRKTNKLPNGDDVESVILNGIFQAESSITGEILEGVGVYLPMAYAEKVEQMFKVDVGIRAVDVDVDVGLEATGKTIPYEWVVIAFLQGEEMSVMKRLRTSRKIGSSFASLPVASDTKLLS